MAEWGSFMYLTGSLLRQEQGGNNENRPEDPLKQVAM